MAKATNAPLVILGSGTAVQTEGTGYAGIYFEIAGESMLMDAGPGTLTRLNATGKNLFDIKRVFLTHYHPDHCLDLAALLFGLRIPLHQRKERLVAVYGPRGLLQLVAQLKQAFPDWLEPRHYSLVLRELAAKTERFKFFTLTARMMQHSTLAYAYRVQAKTKSFVYTGDTQYNPALVELASAADVLIAECSMPDDQRVEGHMTPSDCARVAAEAGVKHLVLTHFYPLFDGVPIRALVRKTFKGRITLAKGVTPIDWS